MTVHTSATGLTCASVIAVAAATLTLGNAASAQTAPAAASADFHGDETIVVTAQRREENLQRVPISVAVLNGAMLDKSTSPGIVDVLRTVPGVSVIPAYQGGGTLVTVRGVTAGQALLAGAGTVGYYLDSVPFGAIKSAIAPDASAYDMQRVEVLRGPQGTLYGVNALNGVVRILTNPADLSHFEFKARTTGSFTQGGGGNVRQDAAINVPLIEDRLAVRATVGYQDDSGWINTPFHKDANGDKLWNLRLRVDAKPTDHLTIDLAAWHSRDKYGAPSDGEAWNSSSTKFDDPLRTNFDTFSGKISYDFGPFSVTSATSYIKYADFSLIDFSPFLGGFAASLDTRERLRVFTEEFSVNSSASGPWRWSAGGIYRKAHEELYQNLKQAAVALDNNYWSKSYAVYGEVTRSFADDKLEITGGIRYFHDLVSQISQNPITKPPVVAPDDNAKATTPRVVLNWHPDRNLTVYLTYSQGFRSGFPQGSAAATIPPAEPDRLINYEGGIKGKAFDGKLSFDAALYYIDWQHVQQNLTISSGGVPLAATVNGKSATGPGAEASISYALSSRFSLNGGFSWNNLQNSSNVITAGLVLFAKGDRMNFSPKYNANAGARYVIPLNDSLKVSLDGSAYYVSKMQNRSLIGSTITVGTSNSAIIPKASFTLDSTSGWAVTLFGDNLSNFHGIASPGFGSLPLYYARIRPRTIGLQLEFKLRH